MALTSNKVKVLFNFIKLFCLIYMDSSLNDQFFHIISEQLRLMILQKAELKAIRTLSAHSAAEFNISPGRWQHVLLVAIVPPERWGKRKEMTATQKGGTLRH
jgi:hypothetical protein